MHGAFAVAQDDRPQIHLLDDAGDAIDSRHVSHANLILENEKKSGNHVTDKILGPETEREADNAGAGQNRQHVDRQFAQQHQGGKKPHGDRDQSREDAAERAGAPLPLEIAIALPLPKAVLEPVDHDARRADDDRRADEDDRRFERVGEQPVD